MNAVTHLEKVITGEVSAVTHLEKVIAGEVSAVTYTEKVITGEATPITHLQKVIAGEASPVTHLEYIWAGGSPTPTEHEYTGAVPVTFNADGEPLLDYLISGNMSQTGTPTPQNPIQPSECGERTINLFNKNDVENKIVSREGVENISNYYILSTFISVDNGVTVSATKLLTDPIRIIRYDANKQFISRTDENTADNIVVDDCAYIRINANKDHWDINTIQVEYGRTASPYEPYGYKIPISSANTTTPVYLGQVESTRQIKKLVLTGEETINGDIGYNHFLFTIQDMRSEGVRLTKLFCTHYQNISDGRPIADVPNNAIYTGGGADSQRVFIKTTDYTTVADFKSYLAAQYAAGTPVTVWYVLAEPTTGIVNEPFRKIGNYADTLSMEQAGVSIPTNNGSTTVDVDTTLEPSEVYIKYKGV